MDWKDLLVHVDSTAACPARLEVALGLATAFGAHLTGVLVNAVPYVPPYIAPEIPVTVLRDTLARYEQDATEVEAEFRRRTERSGLAAEWRRVEGEPGEVLGLHARHADLTVVGQVAPGDDLGPARDLPERLVFAAGRPVLVVPYAGTFPTVGERVVVAWDASREAARALHDALPVLRRARKVTVLSINPDDRADEHRRVPGADISLHLARHGVTVEASQTFGREIQVAEILLSRLVDLGADLLVMGAYGHSRLREMMLGGVTRDVLRHMTVPVLMSH